MSTTTAAAGCATAASETAAVHGGESVIALDASLAAVVDSTKNAVIRAGILPFKSLGAESSGPAVFARSGGASAGKSASRFAATVAVT
jgi:hypothetical protein